LWFLVYLFFLCILYYYTYLVGVFAGWYRIHQITWSILWSDWWKWQKVIDPLLLQALWQLRHKCHVYQITMNLFSKLKMAKINEIALEYQVSLYGLTRKPPYDTLIWVGIWPSKFEVNRRENLGGVFVWNFYGWDFLFKEVWKPQGWVRSEYGTMGKHLICQEGPESFGQICSFLWS